MAEADKRVAQRGVHRSMHSGSMSKNADTKGWRRIAVAMLTASSMILGINLCSPEAGWGQEDTSWEDLYLELQLTEAYISFSQRAPYPIRSWTRKPPWLAVSAKMPSIWPKKWLRLKTN